MKEGILPYEDYDVAREKRKDETALERLSRLLLDLIIKDPEKAEKFLGPDHEAKRT